MPEYRLEELSALSGVSVRNIRAYRERGLLDPPRRQGRTALYDDRHLSQLRAVNELLRKGFTSAHIAEFLSSTRQGHDLADILGLQQAIFGAPRQRAAVTADIDPDGDEARRLAEYGLAEVVDGQLTLINADVADLIDAVAKSIVAAFEQSLSERFGERVADPEEVVELRQLVTDYRSLGRRVVIDEFEDALRRRFVAALGGRVDLIDL